MLSIRSGLVAVALVISGVHHSAQAQQSDRLPVQIITKNEAMRASDKRIIALYVRNGVAQLQSTDDHQIAAAKEKLLAPLQSGASRFFLIEYRRSLGGPLAEVFRSEPAQKSFLIRLNVMIIAQKLGDPAGTELMIAGLKDKNPSVRLWSAKAIASVTAKLGKVTTQPGRTLQKRLLDSLAQAVEVEQVDQVLQQLMPGLVRLTIVEAAPTVLRALNKRVHMHMKNPALPLRAEITGLQGLRLRIVQDTDNDVATKENIRLITQVVARYFMLSAKLLQEGKVPDSAAGNYWQMLAFAQDSLQWLVKRQGVDPVPTTVLNPPIARLVAQKRWRQVKDRAASWQRLLQDDLQFKQEDLALQPPKKDE